MSEAIDGVISAEENTVVSQLKKDGILQRFDPATIFGIAKNGGVGVMCSDGDPDMFPYHTRLTHRPHCVRLFGGSLLFAPSFKGFNEALAFGLLGNIRQGMTVKHTQTLFLYVHAPCGVAAMYGYGIEDQIKLAIEAMEFFAADNFFRRNKIHLLFHVKRINRAGALEQNTYKIDVDAFLAKLKHEEGERRGEAVA
ncbi:MAG: hypothetical protein Q7K35_03810 [bacterium]|nr:hypothetical protein [bacterium]